MRTQPLRLTAQSAWGDTTMARNAPVCKPNPHPSVCTLNMHLQVLFNCKLYNFMFLDSFPFLIIVLEQRAQYDYYIEKVVPVN